jgi:hypothetical protein
VLERIEALERHVHEMTDAELLHVASGGNDAGANP